MWHIPMQATTETNPASALLLRATGYSLAIWSAVSIQYCLYQIILLGVYTSEVPGVVYMARNVFLDFLLVKANNTIISCQLLFLFRGRFERSDVRASCRAPNWIYQTP